MKGYEIFEELLHKKGVKIADVVKATGMTPATIYDWKAGRYRPKDDKRKMIADYFGVTLEYLDTGKDDAGNELPAYTNCLHIIWIKRLPKLHKSYMIDQN